MTKIQRYQVQLKDVASLGEVPDTRKKLDGGVIS